MWVVLEDDDFELQRKGRVKKAIEYPKGQRAVHIFPEAKIVVVWFDGQWFPDNEREIRALISE